MKIVLIAENWPPRIGGIENYLTHAMGHLPAGSVTVIAPQVPKPVSETALPGHGIKAVIRRRFFWPLIRPRWLPLFISLYRYAKREQIDLVVCGKGLFEGLIGYYLNRHLGIPYIVLTYAMEIEVWAEHAGTRRKLTRVITNAARVVYINELTKTTLLSLGATEQQLVKIWPGVDDRYLTTLAPPAIDQVLKKYNLRRPYILSVARLIERKGLAELIEAFAQLDQTKFGQYRLVIVGEGPQKESLKELADNSFITKSVAFLDNVPDQDLPALYQAAEFLALTPKEVAGDREGFGIVYLEAAASGLAALATKSGGAAEAVVDQSTGLVVEPEIPAIKAGLEQLLEHFDKRQQMADAGRKRAQEQFRWGKRSLLVKGMIDAVMTEKITIKNR
ncbi:MAG: glycosyltransferase family 4 protein [Candidatus Andersenbacteria bacterium]